jgi:hypothetical protein
LSAENKNIELLMATQLEYDKLDRVKAVDEATKRIIAKGIILKCFWAV